MKNYITLYYKDLKVEYRTGAYGAAESEPGGYYTDITEIDYEYEVEDIDVAEAIWDSMDYEQYEEFCREAGLNVDDEDNNFIYLTEHIEDYLEQEKYEKLALDYYEDAAREEWEENNWLSYNDDNWDYYED